METTVSDAHISGPLAGMLERADRAAIAGWAADRDHPDRVVELELLIDDAPAGIVSANLHRADLERAGFGRGHHGFLVHLPQGLSPGAHAVRMRRAADGAELAGSPLALDGGAEPRQALVEALDAAAASATTAELEAMIGILARQAASLVFARGGAMAEPEAALIARFAARPELIARPNQRLALFIDEGVPDASRDAGSNAAISHMRALQRLGFSVHFVAGYGLEPAGGATAALESLGITCWHTPWVASVEEVLRRLGPDLDVAYLHRLGVMQRYGALVRRWCPAARLLFCVADLHHLRAARQRALAEGSPVATAPVIEEAAGLRTAELLAVLAADAAITHSSFEAELLRQDAPEGNVHRVAWDVVPAPVVAPFADRRGVGFIGSYGHAPNRDAAHVLVEQVMPLVWAEDPAIPCVLAGSDMPAALRAAAKAAPAGMVTVLGHVASAGEVWERVRLTAAPLRFGAGLKGKVLDSLAAGLPCICSPMAAEGMELPPALSELVCAEPADMARLILRLHGDAEANAALARIGVNWVAHALSAGAIAAGLAAALWLEPPGSRDPAHPPDTGPE